MRERERRALIVGSDLILDRSDDVKAPLSGEMNAQSPQVDVLIFIRSHEWLDCISTRLRLQIIALCRQIFNTHYYITFLAFEMKWNNAMHVWNLISTHGRRQQRKKCEYVKSNKLNRIKTWSAVTE